MSKCTKPASTTTATKTIFNRTGVPFSVRRRERRQASWKGAATNFLWNTLAIAPRKAPVSPSLAVGSERRVFSSPLPFLSHSLSLSIPLSSLCLLAIVSFIPLLLLRACVYVCACPVIYVDTQTGRRWTNPQLAVSFPPIVCVCTSAVIVISTRKKGLANAFPIALLLMISATRPTRRRKRYPSPLFIGRPHSFTSQTEKVTVSFSRLDSSSSLSVGDGENGRVRTLSPPCLMSSISETPTPPQRQPDGTTFFF